MTCLSTRIVLTAFFAATTSAVFGAEDHKQFVGLKYQTPNFDGCSTDAGFTVWRDGTYGVSLVHCGSKHMAWLTKTLSRNQKGMPLKEVRAQLQIPAKPDGKSASIGAACYSTKDDGLQVIAIEDIPGDKEGRTNTAWAIDVGNERFSPIDPENVRCGSPL